MKILVPVKRVVDANIKVKVSPEGTIETASLKKAMNPFDEIALCKPFALTKRKGALLKKLSPFPIGKSDSSETLKVGLLCNGNESKSTLIETEEVIEPLGICFKLLKALTEREKNPQLIIAGKQGVDTDANQVGQLAFCLYAIGLRTATPLL